MFVARGRHEPVLESISRNGSMLTAVRTIAVTDIRHGITALSHRRRDRGSRTRARIAYPPVNKRARSAACGYAAAWNDAEGAALPGL